MILSKRYNNVFWSAYGMEADDGEIYKEGWYYWDKIGWVGGCPFETERDAQEDFIRYCREC